MTTSKGRSILVINGHPDPSPARLCHALAAAYRDGAEAAGHRVHPVAAGTIAFPVIRSHDAFYKEAAPAAIAEVQARLAEADHLVLIYPLWLGMLPAHLKAFLEQLFRPDFAMHVDERGWTPLLKGKSVRVVVTMGMPALAYRLYFRAHSLRALSRNILGFSGMGPIRSTIFGSVEAVSNSKRRAWLETMRALGRGGR